MSTVAPRFDLPRVAGPARSGPRAVWIGYAVIAIMLAAYLGYLATQANHHYSVWLDGWGVDGVEIAASLMCIASAFGRREVRLVPLVLGASLLSWSLGDVALTIESLGGATPATPSVADGLYLMFFPL